jgi:hypothetical protein
VAEVVTPVEQPVEAPVEQAVETPVEQPTEAPVAVALAFENDGSPRGRFIAAVIGNGCALEVSGAEGYLAESADLRMDQAFRIVDEMVAEGEATLISDGSTVQIDLAYCTATGSALVIEQVNPVETVEVPVTTSVEVVEAAEAVVDATEGAVDAADLAAVVEAANAPVETGNNPRAGLLAMLATNNCEVTQTNAAELIAAAGLDFNASMQMLTQMMGTGEATSPDFGQTLQVGAPLCVATGAAEPMTPREIFINLIKQNNCSITAAEFSTMLPVDGLDANTAFGMINELEAEGVITLPSTRDVVTLSAEMCR